jgi:8-oxo-dGTP diphosphatase
VEKNPTWLLVVAALIRDGDGRLLLQQALPGKPHAGQWEFPGGKVESEENPRFALRREIAEELGVALDADAMAPVGFADEPDEGARPAIVLILYECPRWSGEAEGREGQTWGWFTSSEAEELPMPGMDRLLLEKMLGRS